MKKFAKIIQFIPLELLFPILSEYIQSTIKNKDSDKAAVLKRVLPGFVQVAQDVLSHLNDSPKK